MSMSKNIRIRLSSNDHRLLDKSVKAIFEAAKSTGVDVVGPIPIPTKCEKLTVLKSTNRHKKSREQFEFKVHNRLLDIRNLEPNTVTSLTNLDLPAGIDVKVSIGK